MKGRYLTFSGVVSGAIAVLLLLFHNNINVSSVTLGCGVILIAVGLINLVFYGYKSDDAGKTMDLITNAGSIVFGVCMLIFKKEFEPIMTFMMAMFVGICALWQFFVLAIGARPHQLPVWLFLFPVALVIGSVYLFICRDQHNDSLMLLSTGICFAVLAAGCIIEGSVLGMARIHEKRANFSATMADGQDVTGVGAGEKVETTDDLDDEIIEPDKSKNEEEK